MNVREDSGWHNWDNGSRIEKFGGLLIAGFTFTVMIVVWVGFIALLVTTAWRAIT